MNRKCFLLLLAVTAPALAHAAPKDPVDLPSVNDRLGLTASDLIEVRINGRPGGEQLVATVIAGKPVTLYLMPHSLRSDDFELLVQDHTGALLRVDAPPPRTFRGTVVEWAGSAVTGTLKDGRLTARIRRADGHTMHIEPAGTPIADADAPRAAHVTYYDEDIVWGEYRCGVPHEPLQRKHVEAGLIRPASVPDGPDRLGAAAAATTRVTEISFDSDFPYYVDHGDSVENTVDAIEQIMVDVDAIYRSEVGISYVLNRIVVRTTASGPYSSSVGATLLDQFRDEWESNFTAQECDVAHLMTGKTLDVGGIAHVREICNRRNSPIFAQGGYGLSTIFPNNATRAAVTAHELGHNWSARHCSDEADPVTGCTGSGFSFESDCRLLCACLGSCTGGLTRFGSSTTAAIINHRDSRSCLIDSISTTYVDEAYSGIENGSATAPYNTFREGVWATDAGGTVILAGGMYDADRTVRIHNRPLRLEAWPGTGIVTIGQ